MKQHYQKWQSPIGPLHILANSTHLLAISFDLIWPKTDLVSEGNDITVKTIDQLKEYWRGERRDFTLPIAFEGTAFQVSVWKALQKIPYGHTCSYQDQARAIGRPKAMRAVGAANGANPIAIVVPCHRVIGRNGTLTGYGGGLHLKKKLLHLEGVRVN